MKGPFQPVAYPKPYDGSLITVAQLEQLMLGIIIMGAKAGGKKKKQKKHTHLNIASRMLCCAFD